ncbi:MAG: nitronate monooxygenase [Actinomycetota bacterium]|nr:nitronate monooxygenase [Actinomycetota bacterium]
MPTPTEQPVLIQGGMGAGVSDWRLARAVAATGNLGVVSGTGIDTLLARRLQDGDPGGHMRRALSAFPIDGVAERILDGYFIEGGKPPGERYRSKPMPRVEPSRKLLELMVAANFVEVYLAKEGHSGPVGVNYLEKIQPPHLSSIYGAMLAGVDYVLMGAGIPMAIPGVLDRLSDGLPVEYRLDVKGAERGEAFATVFDPVEFGDGNLPPALRPEFLAIVSSHILATALVRKASGRVDGFVIEGPTAGGHNAPPRGKVQFSDSGEPIYGDRDIPDLDVFREIGLPFWLAGGYGEPGQIAEALRLGAAGVQVGTAFAFCEESGFTAERKQQVIELSKAGKAKIFTDPVASPTGFPFKVVELGDSLSNPVVYEKRSRICDLGYLRTAYRRDDGTVGWRCPSEPVDDYVRKGGSEVDTIGRKCLCNSLIANIGHPQVQRNGDVEGELITSGDDVADVARFIPEGRDGYRAIDVIDYLLPATTS